MLKETKHFSSNLTIHLIFVVKYRKQLLLKFGDEIEQLMIGKSNMATTYNIREIECDKDHIHLLIDYLPTESISNIVKQLKAYSVFHIWERNEEILKRQFWKKKMFWSNSYYVASVGDVNQEIVSSYIKSQNMREQKIHPQN